MWSEHTVSLIFEKSLRWPTDADTDNCIIELTARITCRWFCGSSVFPRNYSDPARPWVSSDQSETTKSNSLRKDCYYSIRWFISLALRNYILESISVPWIRFRADWGRRGEDLYQPEVGECWKNDQQNVSYQSGVKDEPVLLFHNIPYSRQKNTWSDQYFQSHRKHEISEA